ncbi:MAG: ABC transporter ATP-binding protein [Bacteroidia bacterium]|nr:ABC transporter ATP-binding protein [Bacteroidia bacterium]
MIETVKKLLKILPQNDRGKLLILFLMMLVGSILEVFGIGMVPVFVSVIQDPDRLFEVRKLAFIWDLTGISDSRDLLVYGSVALVTIFLLKNAYMVFLYYIESKYIYKRFGIIASNLFDAYMNAPYTFHLRRNTAELIRNVTNESREIAYNVLRPILLMGMEIIMIISIFGLLLYVEPTITIIALVLLGGVGGVFLRLIKKRMRYHGKRALKERGRIIQIVNEGLGGFKDATVLNRQDWFIQRIQKTIHPLVKALTFRNITDKAVKPGIETIAISGMVLIAVLLLWQGRTVSAIIPVLSLFGAATIRLMPALRNFISQYNQLRYNSYAVNPVYDDLHELGFKEIKSAKSLNVNKADKLKLKRRIDLKNIYYKYPNSVDEVLKDVSITIQKGEAIGFIGPSGAGKTTIIDLILGLLEPTKGEILIDGVNVKDNKESWQSNIGYIPQFIYLADTSIKQNIAFGLPDDQINEDWLWEAVKAAQIEDMVKRLPNGLNTMVGEQGTQLSGGQRQRVGIARALYHKPQVLIMDEATSALDNYTEKFVLEAIESLRGKRTILTIAHRITTVQNCDMIYLIKEGQILNRGNYEELINSSEEFRRMNLLES